MYKVYIDESGDLGNSFFKDEKNRGSYYFILSAIIVKDIEVPFVEEAVDETKNKLGKNKYFHFVEDTHNQRIVFLNKISNMKNFNSILIAEDKFGFVKMCEMAERDSLLPEEIFEHVVRTLFVEISYMFQKNNGKLEFELIFEENRNINYKNIENIAREFSDDKFNFKICLRDKECKCLQIADYLAGTLFVALEESKIDKQIDESYINKLIGKFYHYDDREFANIAPLHAYRLSEGPYKHRIHLSLTHLLGKFENKKQGWAKSIQECF